MAQQLPLEACATNLQYGRGSIASNSQQIKSAFVLLDRDGTINVERGYIIDPQDVELLPAALRGLKRMAELGLGLVVVTNQSAVGRGYMSLATLEAIHGRLAGLLAEGGVVLDGLYFCPHRPEDNCDCRKPKPGLVYRAASEIGFDPRRAYVVGDNLCDVQLGKRIGATTLLVRTGRGHAVAAGGAAGPDYVVDDLAEAAEVIEVLLAARERGSGWEGR